MAQHMYTNSFTTIEIGTKPMSSNAGRKRSHKGKHYMPSAFAVKMGICTAALAMMLVMREIDIPAAEVMVNSVNAAVNDETDLTEMLGKLQFVEFPSALEVFSGDTQMVYPVIAEVVYLENDADYAEWAGAPNAQVVACSAGEVRAVGEDDILGRYVRVKHSGELETIYYGLDTISVEQGQPVRRQDNLGTLGEEGVLRLSVLLSGKPQPIANYLKNISAG